MEIGFAIGIVLVIAAVGLCFRVFAGGLDQGRVRQYVEDRGGEALDVRWAPFGPGWFGEKSDRIYEVRYRDRDGNEHLAHCKTSLFTGVYFTEDRIIRYAPRDAEPESHDLASLEDENRRLREELERLRRERA